MTASVLSIGDELLLGETKDTNGPFISSNLMRLGVKVKRVVILGDDKKSMEEEIRRCISDSQIIITTGGLGPTEDDLTRFAVSSVFGRPLKLNSEVLRRIEAFLEKRGITPTENIRTQALFPEGSEILENPMGTAPGFVIVRENFLFASLPGVPWEMETMWKQVEGYIKRTFKLEKVKETILHVCGISEGRLNQKIKDLWKENRVKIGTSVGRTGIKIRVMGSPEDVHEVAHEIEKRVGESFVGRNGEDLVEVLKKLFRDTGSAVKVEEDVHTSGLIAHSIGSISPEFLSEARIRGSGTPPSINVISKRKDHSFELIVDFGKGPSKRTYTFSDDQDPHMYVTFVLDSIRRDLIKLKKERNNHERRSENS